MLLVGRKGGRRVYEHALRLAGRPWVGGRRPDAIRAVYQQGDARLRQIC